MKNITIAIFVKDKPSPVEIDLKLKMYVNKDGIRYQWKSINTLYKIDVFLKNIDNYILPENIYKDLTILTPEEDIALSVMEKVQKQFTYERLQ